MTAERAGRRRAVWRTRRQCNFSASPTETQTAKRVHERVTWHSRDAARLRACWARVPLEQPPGKDFAHLGCVSQPFSLRQLANSDQERPDALLDAFHGYRARRKRGAS